MTVEFKERITPEWADVYKPHAEQEAVALGDRVAKLAVSAEVQCSKGSETPLTKEALERRTERLGTLLWQEARSARARALVDEAERGPTGKLKAIMEVDRWDLGQDEEGLEKLGLTELGSAWPIDIVGAMVQGKPLTVHVATPRTAMRVDRYGNRLLDYGSPMDGPDASAALAASLRNVCPVPEVFGIRALVHDHTEPVTGLRLGQAPADETVVRAWDYLREAGLVKDKDAGTTNFALTRAREIVPSVDQLITQLKAEGVGHVVTGEDGAVYFKPTKWAIEATGQSDPRRTSMLGSQGICLKHDADTPAESAIIAASFLGRPPEKGVHLLALPTTAQENYADAYALLRWANVLRQPHYHNLPFKYGGKLGIDVWHYAFMKRLYVETKKFLSALRAYDDVQAMDPRRYIEHTYGRDVESYPLGILPADVQFGKELARVLPKYLKRGQKLRVMNIGHGPFSYLDHALEPYAEFIEAADPAVANQEVTKQYKEGTLEGRYDVGPKFGAMFAHHDPTVYGGCDGRVRKKLIVTDRAMDAMPEGAYDIVAESFVSCSRSFYKTAFWEDIQAKKRSLRGPDSLMMSLHMVGSDGWSAGGEFPSVKMSYEEIRQAYLDADMEILEFIKVPATDKFRKGYDGMVLVIARPRRK